MGRRVKVNAGMIRCGQGLCSQQAGQGVESPATSLGSVVVMLVARDLLLQARALSVKMLSRAPSYAGHAQVSVRADIAKESDAAASRAAGGASAGAGARAIRQAHQRALERELERSS